VIELISYSSSHIILSPSQQVLVCILVPLHVFLYRRNKIVNGILEAVAAAWRLLISLGQVEYGLLGTLNLDVLMIELVAWWVVDIGGW